MRWRKTRSTSGAIASTHILQDIQTLNERATRGDLHITAVSIHALAYVLDKYALLPSGASMGDGYGPLFIAENAEGLSDEADDSAKKGLASRKNHRRSRPDDERVPRGPAFPGTEISTMSSCLSTKFSRRCAQAKADVGLIIHEGQLTYAQEGFAGVFDLGEWWKRTRNLPLPLGGNVIRKDIPPGIRSEISDILRESIAYGLDHRAPGHHAQHGSRPRIGRSAGRPIHRHVRKRPDARLRRKRAAQP